MQGDLALHAELTTKLSKHNLTNHTKHPNCYQSRPPLRGDLRPVEKIDT